MADVLTHMFANMSQADSKKDLVVTPPAPSQCSVLIVGEQSLRRSLLLLTAVTAASQMGIRVVFFAPEQIQSLPASLQKCIPKLSPESLKKIRFCYPRTVEELLQQIAGLHESNNTFPTPPSLVIVDRLEDFLCGPACDRYSGCHPGEQSCAAHVAALLCDTATFLTSVLKQQAPTSSPCRIIASYKSQEDGGDSSVSDPVLDALDRYFEVRCTLHQDRSYKATEAGQQEVWHIYFSGTGITHEPCTTDSQVKLALAQEWQLLMFPDGLMEFKLV
ncbi:ATPase SWSAP1 isoform X1 [Dunckerocampus dactyliophorus]|uniref:ATPase SWSAP1 isoform X1 n=1 Tax=Dunckerocampus dactyliophorus TaxID=161453 RepID=UPI0024066696|nr:ATPase SWSAP1 isoform X1 [Dunckerocampus dactyliophorus]